MFVAKARPSISGSGGHDAVFAVACGLVVGFGLDDSAAWELLCEYNAASCTPSWSDKDLGRKLREARKQAERNPEKVGELANQDAPTYTGPRLPANNLPVRTGTNRPATAPPSGKPPPGDGARTARTALFEVRPFGEGAKARTLRAVRTLNSYSVPVSSPDSSTLSDKSKKEVSGKSVNGAEETKPLQVAKPGAGVKAAAAGVQKPRCVAGERVNVTTLWNDTGEIWKDGKLVGSVNEQRGGYVK